jgi:hypothetical protein
VDGQGQHAAGAAQVGAVVAGYTATRGADAENTLAAKGSYCSALGHLGRHAEAAALGREVLAAREAREEGGTRSALLAKQRLADALRHLQERDEAGRLYREAIEGFTALGGPRHQDTLNA